MPDASVNARAAAIVCATTDRVSELKAELIRRYATSVHLNGTRGVQEEELGYLRELCRLIEGSDFEEVSYQSLAALGALPAPSGTAARRRRRVIGRLIRLLQHSGELPTSPELAASRAIEAIIFETPEGGRGTLRRWLARRRRKLGWHELRWEAKRLSDLEATIVAHPGADDAELTTRWLLASVRSIVNCGCPPITRRSDPSVCTCCGATSASHGTRPSPNEANQRKLRALARRYLQFRRLPTPTRSLT